MLNRTRTFQRTTLFNTQYHPMRNFKIEVSFLQKQTNKQNKTKNNNKTKQKKLIL